jgi:hypothetical protein
MSVHVCQYICFILFPLLYYNYSFIYVYKGYASYIHISRGYVKHKRLRTTDLENLLIIAFALHAGVIAKGVGIVFPQIENRSPPHFKDYKMTACHEF